MLSTVAVSSFASRFDGVLVQPQDAEYEQTRQVFNGMIDRRPALIARCSTAHQVGAALSFAREQGLRVSVRGGGHNVAGSAVCDQGVMIDLAPMNGVQLDRESRIVSVGGGATWAEVNHHLQEFGLAAAGGFVGSTGVGGLTLGGGIGWLVRKHGLALDNLVRAEVVTANGEIVTASADQNPELFWGIRGGGGNFGVVTRFDFKAHPAGTVLAGLVLHPLSNAQQALRFWRDFEATAPEEVTNGALLFHPPAELPVPEVLHREGITGLGGVYTGALEAAERALKPLREFGPPTADIFQPMPYSAAQNMADFLWTRGLHHYWKSSYLRELSDDAIDTIVSFYERVPSRRSVVVLEHNGDGALNRVPDDATAFSYRECAYDILITSQWTDASDSEANVRWTREFFEAMRPFSLDAVYVNYLGEEGEERVRQAYGNKYERLVALKDKYDPDNVFCMNQNIRPSRARRQQSEGAA